MLQTADRAAELRSRSRLRKAVATRAASDAAAPEVAIPAQVVSAFAQEVLRTAQQYRIIHSGGNGGGVGGGYSPGGATRSGAGPAHNRRVVNYSNVAVGGDKAAAVRAMARRSSQRHTHNRAAEPRAPHWLVPARTR